MATFTPDFNAGQTVWVITSDDNPALREGTVIQAKATELTSGTTFKYDVRLEGDNGTTDVVAAKIFADLNAATIAYFTALGGVAGSPCIVG